MSGEVLCIIGHAAEKFTPQTETAARAHIQALLRTHRPRLVISGASPMGGVDVWAIEEAKVAGIPYREFPPEHHTWDPGPGKTGFKARNISLAMGCGVCAVIVVKDFPPGFRGQRFPFCYHCGDKIIDKHIKSGACWTRNMAERLGAKVETIVI